MVGNISNFHQIDILRVFFQLFEKKSRLELVNKLKMGEGTIRNILNKLKKKELIISDKKGHKLSKKGLNLFKKIQKDFELPKLITLDLFYPSMIKIAIHLKNKEYINKKIPFFQLRDIAIKNGAEGALIFKYTSNLKLPGHNEEFPILEKLFNFKKDDLLIIAFANEHRWAEIACISIVSKVLSPLESLINNF